MLRQLNTKYNIVSKMDDKTCSLVVLCFCKSL